MGESMIRQEDIIMEGWLQKESIWLKSYRKRYVVLTQKGLYAYKTEDNRKKVTEMLKMEDFTEVRADEDPDKIGNFCVLTPERTFNLIADNSALRKEWVGCIGREMSKPKIGR